MTRLHTDYVVIGGGTAGLAVASRLTEMTANDVFVLEAGKDKTAEPDLSIPGFAAKLTGNPDVDWMFKSVKQKHAKDRTVDVARGKTMGGSSSINFMHLARAHKEEYDAIEALGNSSWNWASFIDALKKSENHELGPKDKNQLQVDFNPSFHGSSGPIQRTLPKWVPTVTGPFIEGLQSLGIPFNPDANSGNNRGVGPAFLSIDYAKAARSSSAAGYYEPVKERPNLHVLTETLVTKISFSGTDDKGLKIASAVHFIRNNEEQVIDVKKEVILCAGTYQSPQLLELSGIGNARHLQSLGIDPVLDLPGVGENLQVRLIQPLTFSQSIAEWSQDHIRCPYMVEMNPKHESLLAIMNPERAAKEWEAYQETASGMLAASMGSYFAFIPPSDFVSGGPLYNKDAQSSNPTVSIQNEWLRSSTIPHLELAPVPAPIPFPGLQIDPVNKVYFSLLVAHNHPLSRGNVHIKSSDPREMPSIDFHLLENEVDIQTMVEGLKYARKIAATRPMASEVIDKEILPGLDIQDDEQLAEFVRETAEVFHHPVGSVSMMPKEVGGVVDPELRVYGTKNLRVIDASVIPINLSGHTLTAVYAIAEIGTDIIKRTNL